MRMGMGMGMRGKAGDNYSCLVEDGRRGLSFAKGRGSKRNPAMNISMGVVSAVQQLSTYLPVDHTLHNKTDGHLH